jgi:hypothetical protein
MTMATQKATCPRHPDATLRRCAVPPRTANRAVLLNRKRVCDFYDYWRCPVCKVHYCTPKAGGA